MSGSSRLSGTGSKAITFVVVLCIAVAVNVILNNVYFRADLTEEKLYTLSQGTKNILKKLPGPVSIKFFFSSSDTSVPADLKTFAAHVDDLLGEFEQAGNGKIVVEKFDPRPDSEEEDWARTYGIRGQSLGFMEPTIYLGIVVTMGETEAALPMLDPRYEDRLEYSLVHMIYRVSTPEKPVIGVMSSLPVMGLARPPYPMPGQRPQQTPPWIAFQQIQNDYDVRKIDMSAQEIDPDVNALILVHPKQLSNQTMYAIDQFVLRGGNLMVFVDPLCRTDGANQATPRMQFAQTSSDIKPLLSAWGVAYDSGKVVADLEAASRLFVGEGRIEENPTWLSLTTKHLNKSDMLTAHIESIMMPFAGSFTVMPSQDVTVTPLITCSQVSSLVDGMTAQFSIEGVRRDFKSGFKKQNLAIRLHGKLKTAFPHGKPEESPAPGEEEPDSPKTPSLAQSTDKSTVLLVADVDMIYDQFCVRMNNMFRIPEPMNDNLAFFVNSLEQMSGSTDLMGIRTRGKTSRPFDVVVERLRDARAKHQEEEKRLNGRLEEAQRRFNELQSQKDASQRFILTKEQQRQVKDAEDMVTETKKDLKLLRRKLREDIEDLGLKIKLANIVLMPVMVAFVWLGLGVYKRRKNRQ